MTAVKKKILVVDDEQPLLRVLSIKLKICGFDVVTAINGQQALELLESARPDLMLLDVIMPVMDGFQVLEKLRTYSAMPAIAFSARLESKAKALTLGANEFMAKPFDVDDLVDRIRSYVEVPRA
jgi:two-component system KDP operon response regulator KdpE